MTTRQRVGWVDTGRGIAICLVALYHGARWLSKAGFDTEGWQTLNDILSSLRMPLFFTLSGLFARKWLHASWRDLFRSKLLLFIWVFLIWETIGSAAFVLGSASNGHRVSLWDTAISLLWSPLVPKLELWFIWALTLFFVLAKLTRSVNAWVQLVVTAAIAAVALSIWINVTTGATGSAKYYFFFIAGLYLRDVVMRFGRVENRWALAGVLVAWAVISTALSVFGLRGVLGLYFLNCLAGVFAGITLSRILMRFTIFGRIGQQTLPIYLAHTPIIIVISFLMSLTPLPHLFAPDVFATPIVGAAAVTLALVLFGWCSHHRVLRYLYEPPLQLLDRRLNVPK